MIAREIAESKSPMPTPEEIETAKAEILAAKVDAGGVLKVEPLKENAFLYGQRRRRHG